MTLAEKRAELKARKEDSHMAIPDEMAGRIMYDCVFKVGRRTLAWSKFAATQKEAELLFRGALENEYDGKAKIVDVNEWTNNWTALTQSQRDAILEQLPELVKATYRLPVYRLVTEFA